jgi:hypothetical protein
MPGGERRLAVPLADLDVGDVEASEAIGHVPAECGPHDELLPGPEDERLSRVLAISEQEHVCEELDRAKRCLRLPHQAARGAVLQVLEVALRRGAHQRARDDETGKDGLGIPADRVPVR